MEIKKFNINKYNEIYSNIGVNATDIMKESEKYVSSVEEDIKDRDKKLNELVDTLSKKELDNSNKDKPINIENDILYFIGLEKFNKEIYSHNFILKELTVSKYNNMEKNLQNSVTGRKHFYLGDDLTSTAFLKDSVNDVINELLIFTESELMTLLTKQLRNTVKLVHPEYAELVKIPHWYNKNIIKWLMIKEQETKDYIKTNIELEQKENWSWLSLGKEFSVINVNSVSKDKDNNIYSCEVAIKNNIVFSFSEKLMLDFVEALKSREIESIDIDISDLSGVFGGIMGKNKGEKQNITMVNLCNNMRK